MEEIVDLHLSFMEQLLEDGEVLQELEKERITILPGFTDQAELVRSYYRTYYSKQGERIVMCGINPGQYGSGKTGVPFIDFSGISQLLSEGQRNEQERSAQFILSILDTYGAEAFHEAVYLTNLSWYGFVRDGKNLNYYNLPRRIRHRFIESFVKEMDIVQPSLIVPLSEEVERTLRKMAADGELPYPIAGRLPHPMQSSFPANVKEAREKYHQFLEQNTGLRRRKGTAVREQPAAYQVKPKRALDPLGFRDYLLKRHEIDPVYIPLGKNSADQYKNRLENLIRLGIYNGEPMLTTEMERQINLHYRDSAKMYPRTIRYYIEYMEYMEYEGDG